MNRKMYRNTICLILVFVFLNCENKSNEDVISFDTLLENYYEEGLKLNPIQATSSGDNRYNHLFVNTLNDSIKNKIKNYFFTYDSLVNTYPNNKLTTSQIVSKEILKWECEMNLNSLRFKKDLTPIDQMWSVNLFMGQLATGSGIQPFKTVEDYENWLQRVDGYIQWLQSAKEKMQKGISEDYVLPKSLIKKVIPQLGSMVTAKADEHLFYKPIKNLPQSFTQNEKEKITKAYENMVLNKIVPIYKDLHGFMVKEYEPQGRESSGISVLLDGKEYYKHQIKFYTTTHMSANEIHELGLNEVARIRTEMEKIKEEVGFSGTLNAFFEFVRGNKELMPFKTADEVIANFQSIHQKMEDSVNKMFDLQPKTAFEIRQTEAFRAASASAEYNPGSIDGTRSGIFYVPIVDATSYNIYSDEALFLHEAIPGHHFQISLQQENKELPKFRKSLWYSAYGEGWALYTESLGKELGLYDNPYQYFGMLSMEMHRAIRLVVDTGLHAKGWSREDAITYSLENEAESEASIISEVERYMANPGQALAYKIGQLKIRELRAKAEKVLGSKFILSEFHNQVLSNGCIPLSLLEKIINDWIASTKK